jgi:hypothetical protein
VITGKCVKYSSRSTDSFGFKILQDTNPEIRKMERLQFATLLMPGSSDFSVLSLHALSYVISITGSRFIPAKEIGRHACLGMNDGCANPYPTELRFDQTT